MISPCSLTFFWVQQTWTNHTFSSSCMNIWIRDSAWLFWPSIQGSFHFKVQCKKTVVVFVRYKDFTDYRDRKWENQELWLLYLPQPHIACHLRAFFLFLWSSFGLYISHMSPFVAHLNIVSTSQTSQTLSSSTHQCLPTPALSQFKFSRERIC